MLLLLRMLHLFEKQHLFRKSSRLKESVPAMGVLVLGAAL